MTVTNPRPALAPAAEALAAAYVQNMGAGPPPPDDRARAECHRAGRAALAHLRQLQAVADWAAAHLPEPAAALLEVRLRWERGRVLPWRKEICRKAEDARLSSLLKNPPTVASLVGLVGSLGLLATRIEVRGPLAAGIGTGFASDDHQVGASARSLGSRTRL